MPRTSSYHLHLPHVFAEGVGGGVDRSMFFSRVLIDLGNKIALLFLPLFLYLLGAETNILSQLYLSAFQKGMLVVGLFYLAVKVVSLVAVFPVTAVIAKLGLKRSLLYSHVLRMAVFLCLYLSSINPWWLVPAMVLEAIHSISFWSSYHTLMHEQVQKKAVSHDLSLVQFFSLLGVVIAPALAGTVGETVGLSVLFLVGLVTSLGSFVLSFPLGAKQKSSAVTVTGLVHWLGTKSVSREISSQAGKYINDALLYVWPLYIFILVGSIDKVGFLYTLSSFLVLFVLSFVDVYVPKKQAKMPYFFSGGVLSFLWFARAVFMNVWGIVIIDSIEKFTNSIHWLQYETTHFAEHKGIKLFEQIIFSEVVATITGILFWSFFCGYFLLFSSWQGMFVLGGIAVLLSMLTTMRGSKKKD